MLSSGSPLPLPQMGCRTLVATLVIDVKSGMSATVYLMTMLQDIRKPPRWPDCAFLDYDYRPFHGDVFTSIAARLRELAEHCKPRPAYDGGGVKLFAPKGVLPLAEQALDLSWMQPAPLPDAFVPRDLEATAAAHITSGRVRLCAPAYEKAKTSPLGGALDLKAGDDIEENPLKRAIVLAASLVFVDPHELARAARAAARV